MDLLYLSSAKILCAKGIREGNSTSWEVRKIWESSERERERENKPQNSPSSRNKVSKEFIVSSKWRHFITLNSTFVEKFEAKSNLTSTAIRSWLMRVKSGWKQVSGWKLGGVHCPKAHVQLSKQHSKSFS